MGGGCGGGGWLFCLAVVVGDGGRGGLGTFILFHCFDRILAWSALPLNTPSWPCAISDILK